MDKQEKPEGWRHQMVKIVTDSTADLPADLAARMGITVVPALVMFGSTSYREGIDLTHDEFYAKLVESKIIPTTGAPPPGVYEEVYRRLAQETNEILSVHLAANLSALYNVASVAAAAVSGARIALVDSQQITLGYGLIALAAAEAAQRGEPLAQILDRVEGWKKRARVYAALDTLEYIHRGGRVSWVAAVIGTLMHIKPIVQVLDGEVRLVERVRTSARAEQRLLELVQDLGPLEKAVVLHTNAPNRAERLADRIQELDPRWERMIAPAGVIIASHAGPGAVGVACLLA